MAATKNKKGRVVRPFTDARDKCVYEIGTVFVGTAAQIANLEKAGYVEAVEAEKPATKRASTKKKSEAVVEVTPEPESEKTDEAEGVGLAEIVGE